MSLTKEISIDKIEVLEDGTIQIRQVTKIIENEQQLSQSFYRCVLHPGDDISDQDDKVKNIAETVWTPEIVSAFAAKVQTLNELLGR